MWLYAGVEQVLGHSEFLDQPVAKLQGTIVSTLNPLRHGGCFVPLKGLSIYSWDSCFITKPPA